MQPAFLRCSIYDSFCAVYFEKMGRRHRSLPLWTHEKRPELIGNDNKVRQGEYQKPEPPESGDMKTKQEDGDPNETKR